MTRKRTEVILHVGTTKTGTSSLQSTLFQLTEQLKARGVGYPNFFGDNFGWKAVRGMGSGNADVNEPISWHSDVLTERIQWMIEQAVKQDPECSTHVLISEHLSPLAVKKEFWETLALTQSRNKIQIRVVAYLRDPFRMFLACYQQVVKLAGYKGDLDDFVDVFWNSNVPLSFCFPRNIEAVHHFALSTRVQLELHQYEAAGKSIENHFFKHILGIDFTQFQFEPQQMNQSLTPTIVEFHRGVNVVSEKLGQLLGFERSDTLLSKNSRQVTLESDKYTLSLPKQQQLLAYFETYRASLSKTAAFADQVDYSIDSALVTAKTDARLQKYREQIFELGRFVGLSYESGYIDYDYLHSRA